MDYGTVQNRLSITLASVCCIARSLALVSFDVAVQAIIICERHIFLFLTVTAYVLIYSLSS